MYSGPYRHLIRPANEPQERNGSVRILMQNGQPCDVTIAAPPLAPEPSRYWKPKGKQVLEDAAE